MTRLIIESNAAANAGTGIAPAAQQAADGRSQDEAHPERRADQPQPLGTVLLVGHIGDVCLRHGDIAARQPINDGLRNRMPMTTSS